jgi:hypothetical protein
MGLERNFISGFKWHSPENQRHEKEKIISRITDQRSPVPDAAVQLKKDGVLYFLHREFLRSLFIFGAGLSVQPVGIFLSDPEKTGFCDKQRHEYARGKYFTEWSMRLSCRPHRRA